MRLNVPSSISILRINKLFVLLLDAISPEKSLLRFEPAELVWPPVGHEDGAGEGHESGCLMTISTQNYGLFADSGRTARRFSEGKVIIQSSCSEL